jgi:hypothetical protein
MAGGFLVATGSSVTFAVSVAGAAGGDETDGVGAADGGVTCSAGGGLGLGLG